MDSIFSWGSICICLDLKREQIRWDRVTNFFEFPIGEQNEIHGPDLSD